MNQPKPSPNQHGPAGPGGTIVNPAAQQAPVAGQPMHGYAPVPSPHPHSGHGYPPAPQQYNPGYAPAASPAPPQGHHGYQPAASPAPPQGHQAYPQQPQQQQQPGGYSPYPGVAMPKGYPTSAGQPPAGAPAQAHPGKNRNDELDTGGARTVYEFSGAAAGAGDKRTFVGSLDSMPDLGTTERSERSTNLKSGASSWVLIIIGVAVVGGGLAFLSMTKGDASESEPEPAPAAAAAPADAAKTDAAAATSGAEPTADAAKKAEEEAAAKKAEEEAAAKKAEEEAAAKKKAATKKKTTKKATTTPKADPEPADDGPTKLSPKKPPRDDGFGNLPKPP